MDPSGKHELGIFRETPKPKSNGHPNRNVPREFHSKQGDYDRVQAFKLLPVQPTSMPSP